MVWRWRNLAKYIAYNELLFMVTHGFVPLNYGDFKTTVHLMAMTFSWFLYSCDLGSAIIGYTIGSLLILFLEFPFVYKETWTVSLVSEKLFTVLTLFLILTLISMLVTYIAQIRGKMGHLIKENIILLDRMHEGLIVISADDSSDKRLKFASKPAI